MDMSSPSSASSSMSSMNPGTSDSSMQIIFFTSTSTPLYSTSWTPSTTGQYAGTCIFVIILAVIFRTLFALRAIQERKWQRIESKRRYVIAGVEEKEREMSLSEEESKRNDEGDIKVFKRKSSAVRPWRITQDLPRACLDVVIAGVGYLL